MQVGTPSRSRDLHHAVMGITANWGKGMYPVLRGGHERTMLQEDGMNAMVTILMATLVGGSLISGIFVELNLQRKWRREQRKIDGLQG